MNFSPIFKAPKHRFLSERPGMMCLESNKRMSRF
jgi:hypothetical protein